MTFLFEFLFLLGRPYVFVSYRRSDEPYVVDRLVDHLEKQLGKSRVFRDVTTIEAGEAFGGVITEQLELTDVVLVVIGPGWAAHRLADPGDWVRKELELGLEHGAHLRLVCVGGAEPPPPDVWTGPLAPLAEARVHRLDDGPAFAHDVRRLRRSLSRKRRSASLTLGLPLLFAAVTTLCCGVNFVMGPDDPAEDPVGFAVVLGFIFVVVFVGFSFARRLWEAFRRVRR